MFASAVPEPVPDPTGDAAERYALAAIVPLWMAAGSADWFLHRRSQIESTSGAYESRLHALGISLSAIPVLAGLFLEIEAGVLAVMSAGYVLHLGMTIWDVSYADERRRIVPTEQHVHALLELMPFCALSLVGIAHRAQLLALVGRGAERARWRPRLKRRPIAPKWLALTMGSFLATVALPYAEELTRCMRHERRDRRDAATS